MKKPVFGLIGCGAAAKRYYVPALQEHPDVCKNLILVDKNKRQAEDLASELGSTEISDDYKSIMGKVQGAIIIVPNFLHYQIVKDFLEVGTHIFCEKPLTESTEQAHELIDLATNKNVSVALNNTRRMFPSFQMVKEIMSSGELGDLRKMKYVEGMTFAWPSETGFYVNPAVSSKGVFSDIGSHVMDTICWWLDGKPDLVKFEDDSFGGPESVASVNAKKGNCDVEVFFNRLNDLNNFFELTFDNGSVKGEIFNWSVINIISKSGKVKKKTSNITVNLYPDFVKPMVKNFIEVVKGNQKPLVTGEDVLPSIELIEEAYNKRQRFSLPWYENMEAF